MTKHAPGPAMLVENRLLETERRAAYDHALAAAARGQGLRRIPEPRGLRERRHGAPFHATPEVFFQQSGATRFSLPEESFTQDAGELCIIAAGLPHGEKVVGPPDEYLTLVMMFQAEGFSLHFCTAAAARNVRAHNIDRVVGPGARRVERYLADLLALRQEGAAADDPAVLALWAVFFSQARRALKQPLAAPSAPASPLAQRCRDLVQLHLAEPELNVQWLAKRLGCTPDHLSRVYRRAWHVTLTDAIHEARVAQAKRYLAERGSGAPRLNEVATHCGYRAHSHFNRVFLAHTGRTPGQWREAWHTSAIT
jgi:AraC-like DNA-binding protein